MPAVAASNEGELLAAFVLLGADYRDKGPDQSFTGNRLTNVSQDPLVFHVKSGDTTITISGMNCRYVTVEDIKDPGSDHAANKVVTVFDFNKLRNPKLEDGGLGSWNLTGFGPEFECSNYSRGDKHWKACRTPITGDRPDLIRRDLNGGAEGQDVRQAFGDFFSRICRK